jgi:hypothetical protein
MPGTRSGAFIPQVHQVSDDSYGVHKGDHTRGVDTKQLDDGIDYTFVSAGRSGDALSVSSLLSFVPFDVVGDPVSAEPIPKHNRQAPTGSLILL